MFLRIMPMTLRAVDHRTITFVCASKANVPHIPGRHLVSASICFSPTFRFVQSVYEGARVFFVLRAAAHFVTVRYITTVPDDLLHRTLMRFACLTCFVH